MAAVFALHSHLRCSNRSSACVCDNAWDHNKLTDEVALQFSQHAGVLISVDLHLEDGNIVSFLKVFIEIVSFVDMLNRFLELNNK